jgi:Fic family protein
MAGEFISKTWQSEPGLEAPARYKKACRYELFFPNLIADFNEVITVESSALVSKAEAAIHRLNSSQTSALEPFAKLLLRSESIASSKIEGMQVTASELARAEIKIVEGARVGLITREVISNIEAMQVAIEQASKVQEFALEDLIAIHKVLLAKSSNNRVAGKIRTDQNWIGGNDYNPCGADFVPPPPEDVLTLLIDLFKVINSDDMAPLAQAALVHAQFETIHPFADGNGRTGRALVHVIMRRRNLSHSYVLPISILFAQDKAKYIRGLTSFREIGFTEWLETFAIAAINSAKLAESYLTAIEKVQAEWITQLNSDSKIRSDSSIWKIIEILPSHPVVTTSKLMEVLGKTKNAINVAIGYLEKSGILIPTTTGPRYRIWEAPKILTLLDDLGSGIEIPN